MDYTKLSRQQLLELPPRTPGDENSYDGFIVIPAGGEHDTSGFPLMAVIGTRKDVDCYRACSVLCKHSDGISWTDVSMFAEWCSGSDATHYFQFSKPVKYVPGSLFRVEPRLRSFADMIADDITALVDDWGNAGFS